MTARIEEHAAEVILRKPLRQASHLNPSSAPAVHHQNERSFADTPRYASIAEFKLRRTGEQRFILRSQGHRRGASQLTRKLLCELKIRPVVTWR